MKQYKLKKEQNYDVIFLTPKMIEIIKVKEEKDGLTILRDENGNVDVVTFKYFCENFKESINFKKELNSEFENELIELHDFLVDEEFMSEDDPINDAPEKAIDVIEKFGCTILELTETVQKQQRVIQKLSN